MEQVIRYKCPYCGKEFKTANRHKCKYNPEFKNCYTCDNNKGFYLETIEKYHAEYTEERDEVFVDCEFEMFEDPVYKMGKDMQCESYVYCGGRWTNNKYKEEREKKIYDDLENIEF